MMTEEREGGAMTITILRVNRNIQEMQHDLELRSEQVHVHIKYLG